MTVLDRVRAISRSGPRLLVPLMAVRILFVLVQYVCSLVVLGAWPDPAAAACATAIGATSWLLVVTRSGPEKTALRLIPRARLLRADLVTFMRPLIFLVPLPLLAATAVGWLVAPDTDWVLFLAGAAYYTALGCNLLGIAVHRALGRPGRDVADYVVLTAAPVLFASLVWWAGLTPLGYLTGLAVFATLLDLALLRGLGRGRAEHPGVRRSLRRLLVGNIVLMGTTEVVTNAGTSLLYVELWAAGQGGQSADLYRAGQGWAMVIAFAYFLQRLFQPRLAVRLAGTGAAGGLIRSRAIARLSVWLSAAWLAGAAVLIGAGLLPDHLLLSLVLLISSRAPIFLLMSYCGYLLETAGGLRASARGATLGMASVAVTGLAVVPWLGATGAIYALGMKELVNGLIIMRATTSHRTHRAKDAHVEPSGLSG
ncbi:MAG: hypothetical protein ABIS86_17900 [Streptosporangiaceae bacterium]